METSTQVGTYLSAPCEQDPREEAARQGTPPSLQREASSSSVSCQQCLGSWNPSHQAVCLSNFKGQGNHQREEEEKGKINCSPHSPSSLVAMSFARTGTSSTHCHHQIHVSAARARSHFSIWPQDMTPQAGRSSATGPAPWEAQSPKWRSGAPARRQWRSVLICVLYTKSGSACLCWIGMEPVEQTEGKKLTHVHGEAGTCHIKLGYSNLAQE